MKNLVRNEKGFSLVGAVVAVGISAGMITVLSNMIINTYDAKAAIEVLSEASEVHALIKNTIGRPHICRANFNAASANPIPTNLDKGLQPGSKLDLTNLIMVDEAGNPSSLHPLVNDKATTINNRILSPDHRVGGSGKVYFAPQSRLQMIQDLGQGKWIGELQLRYTDGFQNNREKKGKVYVRKVPLVFYFEGGVLQSCSNGATVDIGSQQFDDQLCNLASQGWLKYDAASGSCVDKYECIESLNTPGNPNLATCPAGSKLMTQDPNRSTLACQAVSSTNLAPVQYVGTNLPMQNPPNSGHHAIISLTECACGFPVGATNMKCKASCMQIRGAGTPVTLGPTGNSCWNKINAHGAPSWP